MATNTAQVDPLLLGLLLLQGSQTSTLVLDTSAATASSGSGAVTSSTTQNYTGSGNEAVAGNTSNNANYRVSLSQKGTNLTVVGNAPQDFEFSLQNDYTDLLTLMGSLGGNSVDLGPAGSAAVNLLQAGALAAGYGQSVAATMQVWTGTHPLEFTLPISFRAYSDPSKDVIVPLRTLIQMGSADRQGAWMKAPGPTPADLAMAVNTGANGYYTGQSFLTNVNNSITMQFGQSITVPGLIITGITVKLYNRAERNTGLPIAAEATVSLRTVIAYGKDDILNMFYGVNYGGGFTVNSANTSAAGAAAGG